MISLRKLLFWLHTCLWLEEVRIPFSWTFSSACVNKWSEGVGCCVYILFSCIQRWRWVTVCVCTCGRLLFTCLRMRICFISKKEKKIKLQTCSFLRFNNLSLWSKITVCAFICRVMLAFIFLILDQQCVMWN